MDLDLFQESPGCLQFHIPIHGNGMVNRCQGWEAQTGKPQETIGQTLVVMDDIVGGSSGTQITVNPPAESEGFRKSPGAHGNIFDLVQRRQEIPKTLHLEKVVRVIEIEPRKFMQFDAVGQNRVRRTGDHFYIVVEVPQGPAEIVDIYPLTPASRITPIG